MLRFLRKIRKSLIDSGSFQKYVLYAIGEIVLVVVGILIALQINNWNETRKNRNLEKILLDEVNQEFNYNLAEFEDNLGVYRQVHKNLSRLDAQWPFEESAIRIDSLAKLFERTDFVGNFDVSLTSLEKLKSTTTLDILTNNELKNLLLKFEVLAQDYIQTEQEYLDYHNQIYVPQFMQQGIIYPYSEGINYTTTDNTFLNSVEFKNLMRFKRSKIVNMFRTVDRTEGLENIVYVMERIILLSKRTKN